MKRQWMLWLTAIALATLLAGCGGSGKGPDLLQPAYPLPTLDASGPEGAASDREDPSGADEPPANQTPAEGVDVDLTILSSTMVYGEVYNMMTNPQDYEGKVIRLRGQYSSYYSDPPGEYLHFAVITDALACCVQGMEFLWTGEHSYPQDYPAEQTEIEITGVFERFEDQGSVYYRIVTDSLEVL